MRLAPVFSDHAVLQRGQLVPVWGTAAPRAKITVRCAGCTAATTASAQGRWLVRLPPLPVGGPYELVASAGEASQTVKDVLVGEVWLASGQSNMQWPLKECSPDGSEAAGGELPQVRFLNVETPAASGRGDEVVGRWTACTPASLMAFSAIGGWFGRELHRNLGVPIGVINNAWGGTRVQAWMSREALMLDPSGRDDLAYYEARLYAPDGGQSWATAAEWEKVAAPTDPGDRGSPQGWQLPVTAPAGWADMLLPAHWQDRGHPYSGVFWFRREIQVPAAWAGRDLELHLGAIDKHDDTYVNGERVGGLSWEKADSWCTKRVYRVPGRLVGADGRVVVAIRARSHVYQGGLTGPAEDMRLHPVDEAASAVPLAGTWRYRIEQNWGLVEMPWGEGNPNSPGILFDSRVAPLIPYALRGTIWYQGESNASEAATYRRLLPLMIRDWRRAWGQGDTPFYQVQLANFKAEPEQPCASAWAALREAQAAALSEPATGMAVAIDVGEAGNIHPRNKRAVAQRLARLALSEVYQRPGVARGPVFTSCSTEPGGRIRCRFDHGGAGLRIHGDRLRHIAICGRDRRFVWAEAVVEDDTLVVWSPQVERPVAVRYAWADNPAGCNLGNAEGLPAVPFRTDTFPETV